MKKQYAILFLFYSSVIIAMEGTQSSNLHRSLKGFVSASIADAKAEEERKKQTNSSIQLTDTQIRDFMHKIYGKNDNDDTTFLSDFHMIQKPCNTGVDTQEEVSEMSSEKSESENDLSEIEDKDDSNDNESQCVVS